MDQFCEALLSDRSNQIPEAFDWFSPLLGEWDFHYIDGYHEKNLRQIKGEWIFRRVLNGMAIQDLFICPSRDTMKENPQPDGEYGVAIRVFNQAEECYDMVYACGKYIKNLQFKKIAHQLVGTVLQSPAEKWVFSEIEKDTFHWQNITTLEDGSWKINCDVFAHRKNTK